MFHILSGSTPANTKTSAVSDSFNNTHNELNAEGFLKAEGPTCSSGSPGNDHRPASNKKRSRRRRKGKSRTKVEPLTAFKNSPASPRSASAGINTNSSSNTKKQHDAPMTKRDIYFALDCEMVGVGADGMTSAVGRVSIVNWENQVVLDTYVRVPSPVTDYRTHVSGITPEHLQPRPGHTLLTFSEVREKVQSILRGKILIGHGLENDLKALGLYHPWTDIRDTATYSFFMREFRDPVTQTLSLAPKKLRDLAWEKLGRQIQMPGAPHSPMEDAVAALDLYKEARGQWEDHLIKIAQQKDQEQHCQLMERRRQQEEERRQRQQQQRQQQIHQMRRFQWLAGGGAGQPAEQPVYPCHVRQQQQSHHPGIVHPVCQSHSFRYPQGIPPGMLMMHAPPSPAAAAYLQSPATAPPQPSMRPASWFGFSRRPKTHHHHHQPSRIPPAASHDSVATMTTVQSSFSQDFSSARGAWHVREEYAEEPQRRMATESSQETILEETVFTTATAAVPVVKPDMDEALLKRGEYAESTVSLTESVTEISATENLTVLLTDYEPPRYFTNPDPEPMSSLSWFKLGWGSRRGDKDSHKGEDMDNEVIDEQSENSKHCRRGSDGEPTSYSLFSGRLFPRRNSESCMTDICEKEEDEHSRSLH